MVTKFEDLDPNATYSFADYLTWQFPERVELIKGKLFKMAMPSEKHQRVSKNLQKYPNIGLCIRMTKR
jgi:Uma2 family endonuclease